MSLCIVRSWVLSGAIVACAGPSLSWASTPEALPEPAIVADVDEPAGPLSLPQAIRLALSRSPLLAARQAERRAREGLREQAGLLPNPELEWLRENWGNDRLRDTDGPQSSLSIGQLIELGGKRGARLAGAEAALALADGDYRAARAELLAEVAQAFAGLLHAQAKRQLAAELTRLAEETHRAVAENVKAGKVSPLERRRAAVTLAGVRLDAANAERELAGARARLAATWGGAEPRFTVAEAEWEHLPELPGWAVVQTRLASSPEHARWVAAVAQREAERQQARARRLPDLTLRAGLKRYEDLDEDVYLVGVSVPLPLFDRNQGGLAAAEAQLDAARSERQAVVLRVQRQARDAYARVESARALAEGLRREVLPGAEQVLHATREGYRHGKFGLLDVLDAQRSFFSARAQYLAALTECHQRLAELERLMGGPLAGDPAPESKE